MPKKKWGWVYFICLGFLSLQSQIIPPYWSSVEDLDRSYFKEKFIKRELDSLLKAAIVLDVNWGYQNQDGDIEKIKLPHRVLRPNTKLVYEAQIQAQAAYLKISADDGARLFIDGKFVAQDPYGFHLIPDGKSKATIKVEVLNNAMFGGLNNIRIFDQKQYQTIVGLTEKSLAFRGTFPHFEGEPGKINHIKRLAFWGDSQGGWDTFYQIAARIQEEKPDLYIGLGDLVSHGIESSEWYSLHTCLRQMKAPGLLVVGNHDYDGYADELNPLNYKKYMGTDHQDPTYFSYYTDNAAFIALDPNRNFPLAIDADQYRWFLNEVSSDHWKKARWHFVLTHQPPYGQGWQGYHGEDYLADLVAKHAETTGIDFFLSGHVHDYERTTRKFGSQKTHFIVTGGGGGSLEPVANSDYPIMDVIHKKHHFVLLDLGENEARLVVKDLSGQIIDEYKFEK